MPDGTEVVHTSIRYSYGTAARVLRSLRLLITWLSLPDTARYARRLESCSAALQRRALNRLIRVHIVLSIALAIRVVCLVGSHLSTMRTHNLILSIDQIVFEVDDRAVAVQFIAVTRLVSLNDCKRRLVWSDS